LYYTCIYFQVFAFIYFLSSIIHIQKRQKRKGFSVFSRQLISHTVHVRDCLESPTLLGQLTAQETKTQFLPVDQFAAVEELKSFHTHQ
jgi:hypothetical protein